MSQTPPHYQSPFGITPWDFCAGIQTSGNPFADHLRCSAIEYAFRIKEDPAGDLIKAANCLMRAAAALALAPPESSTCSDIHFCATPPAP